MSFLSDNQKKILSDFGKFVVKELNIKNPPTIVVQNSREKLRTTANYDYGKKHKIMRISKKNRALVDVLRSIGHELTHHKQWEQGRLKEKPPDIGGPIEDEANAMAGRFIKMFAKENPEVYDE